MARKKNNRKIRTKAQQLKDELLKHKRKGNWEVVQKLISESEEFLQDHSGLWNISHLAQLKVVVQSTRQELLI